MLDNLLKFKKCDNKNIFKHNTVYLIINEYLNLLKNINKVK